MGGFFGGIVPAWPALRLDYDALASRGSSLGCAALRLIPSAECPVKAAADVAAFFARHNAQQCGTCMSATSTIAAALSAFGNPQRRRGYEARLTRWGHQLRGRGACAVPDGLAILLRSLLRNYPEVVSRHVGSGCAQCRDAQEGARWAYLRLKLPDGEPASAVPDDQQLTLAGER
jgi:NADH:ubiquinone oxidoreductase subunit F (NADH-binding)